MSFDGSSHVCSFIQFKIRQVPVEKMSMKNIFLKKKTKKKKQNISGGIDDAKFNFLILFVLFVFLFCFF